jgi:hypothetical protein
MPAGGFAAAAMIAAARRRRAGEPDQVLGHEKAAGLRLFRRLRRTAIACRRIARLVLHHGLELAYGLVDRELA